VPGRLRFTALALALSGGLLLAGGGAGTSGAAQSASGQRVFRTSVYFLTEHGTAAIGVRRTIRPDREAARAALQALLAGPTAAEARQGITTAIPTGARIRSFSVRQGQHTSDAIVDLVGLAPARQASAVTKARVITQITRSLVGLSDVGRVWLRGNGRPWGMWDIHGRIEDVPHTYQELIGFYRLCSSASGTETVPGDCFTALP
jgi:hypothetical protein